MLKSGSCPRDTPAEIDCVKIAWFTPFSTKSAIGRVGNLVARELSTQAEVHIWHNDKEDLRQTTLQTIYFPSAAKIDFQTLAAYDAIVYNFGNHLPFHKEIFDISRRVPASALCTISLCITSSCNIISKS